MTGLYLLFVTGLWLVLVIWLSKFITRKFPQTRWCSLLGLLLFIVLLPLPVADEIVGGWQFKQLCKENSTIQVDRATAVGRPAYFAKIADVEIEGTWVRVVLQKHRLVDTTTGETVIGLNKLVADGGLLIQTLGISERNVPLTFKGWCQPSDQFTWEKLLKDLNIVVVSRPESIGETK